MAYQILWPENYEKSDQLQGKSTLFIEISKGRTVASSPVLTQFNFLYYKKHSGRMAGDAVCDSYI